MSLEPTDRILILAPHPDDEVLCCGGIIQQAVAMGLPLRIVFFTYGDNNQWSFLVYRKHPVVIPRAVQRMGLVRHDEAVAAANILGVSPEHLTFLGYPDFGTFHIWTSHWGSRPPFRSMLTQVTAVPYASALRPGAPYTGDEVLQDLTSLLREVRPTKVFVSHPGDHMPDHLALYLFTRVALWGLESELNPQVFPYLVHLKHWPHRGYRPTQPLAPPARFAKDVNWTSQELTPDEVERKHEAITAHRSQYAVSAKYLLSFIRSNELFGDFPTARLITNAPLRLLSRENSTEASEGPEQLTDQEQATFVGFEDRSVRLEDNHLVISMRFSRPLVKAVKASVYVFGYRADRPFAQMPKLHLQFGELHHDIFDQDQPLPKNAVAVTRDARRLTIRIPLELLGDPQKILTSARTYLGDVPLDWISWRVVELSQ